MSLAGRNLNYTERVIISSVDPVFDKPSPDSLYRFTLRKNYAQHLQNYRFQEKNPETSSLKKSKFDILPKIPTPNVEIKTVNKLNIK